jgi:hypothetical protein
MDSQRPIVARTLGIFAIGQLIAILITVGLKLLDVDVGSSTNLVGAVAAAGFASHMFVTTTGRAPTFEERRRLAWLSLAISWMVSLSFLAVIAALSGIAVFEALNVALSALPFAALVVIVVVVSAFYLGGFYVMYGWAARNLEKKLALKRQAL